MGRSTSTFQLTSAILQRKMVAELRRLGVPMDTNDPMYVLQGVNEIGCDIRLPMVEADADDAVRLACNGIAAQLPGGSSVNSLRCTVDTSDTHLHFEISYRKVDPAPLQESITVTLR